MRHGFALSLFVALAACAPAGKIVVVAAEESPAADLDALATWSFEPVRFVGRAVNTTYTVPFHFATH